RRRLRGGRWRRRLWGAPALLVPAALIGYATQKAASLPTLLLLGGSLVCAALALRAPEGQGRDRL
ncbi:PrsW family intramembrane metalloprotease, partial [Streptomyces sp. NPDC001508]